MILLALFIAPLPILLVPLLSLVLGLIGIGQVDPGETFLLLWTVLSPPAFFIFLVWLMKRRE